MQRWEQLCQLLHVLQHPAVKCTKLARIAHTELEELCTLSTRSAISHKASKCAHSRGCSLPSPSAGVKMFVIASLSRLVTALGLSQRAVGADADAGFRLSSDCTENDKLAHLRNDAGDHLYYQGIVTPEKFIFLTQRHSTSALHVQIQAPDTR